MNNKKRNRKEKRRTMQKLQRIMALCMTGAAVQALVLLRLCYDLVRCRNASFGRFGVACVAAAFLYGFGWASETIYEWLYVREQSERTEKDGQKDEYHG